VPESEDRDDIRTSGSSGFWSYAHDDNDLDGGAILKLVDLIAQEYDLLSGESLRLFVDRDGIAWGDQWRDRINTALTQTTFFIPIITPRYFTRPECRRELLEFAAKAKSLSVEELLLPILYVKPPNFSSENPDEAVALVARMQYVDWTATRLLEPDSRDYRTAVNRLALRLIEIGSHVTQDQFERELNENGQDEESAGIADLMHEVMKLLPDWLDAVMGERVVHLQIDVTFHQTYTPVLRLEKSHAPASAILAAQMRVGKEILPILERYQKDARIYLTRSAELDPSVSALSRLVAASPQDFALVMPLREAIDEAMNNISGRTRPPSPPSDHTIQDHFIELKNRARIFQRCDAIWRDIGRLVREGNDIVRRWDSELRRPVPEISPP
jgi:hypothetical protein